MLHLKILFIALWQQNFYEIIHSHLSSTIYLLFSLILLLENGILIAMLLPGDSLLFLSGILISKGVLTLPNCLLFFSLAAWLGYEFSYWQGSYLANSAFVTSWSNRIPDKYHQRSYQLLEKYGTMALLTARFTAFIRTLLPLIMGMSRVNKKQFHYANALSSFVWIFLLINLSSYVSKTKLFLHYQRHFLLLFTLLPLLMLLIGILVTTWLYKCKNQLKTP